MQPTQIYKLKDSMGKGQFSNWLLYLFILFAAFVKLGRFFYGNVFYFFLLHSLHENKERHRFNLNKPLHSVHKSIHLFLRSDLNVRTILTSLQ